MNTDEHRIFSDKWLTKWSAFATIATYSYLCRPVFIGGFNCVFEVDAAGKDCGLAHGWGCALRLLAVLQP
jgi:hypothetical protein